MRIPIHLDRVKPCGVFTHWATVLPTLLLLAGVAGVAGAQNEGKRVEKVDVQGLTSYRPEQVLPRLKTQPGGLYRSTQIREDLSELSRIMRMATVQTEPSGVDGVIVHFVVEEFPLFRKLQVIGNQKVNTERIEALAKLKPGDVLDEKTQRSLKRALQEEYKRVGLPQAAITLNVIDVSSDQPPVQGTKPAAQADLQISINEGKQVLADDLIFKGNEAFSSLRLRSQIETSGSWAFIKNYFSEDQFEDDLAKLREFYAYHGYFDAQVERGMFEEHIHKGMTAVSPVLQITEGERYRFGQATVRGARLFSQAEVLAPFEPLRGEPFEGRRFAEALEKLQGIYFNHGLLTTEIAPKYDYNHQNKTLNMTIEITEKDRIYVGKVKLQRPSYAAAEEGGWFHQWYDKFSPPVKEEAVQREMLLKPGEIYNKRLERDSLRRLTRMGIFKEATLKAYNQPTGEAGMHDVVIEAEDTVTGALSGGVGFGDATGGFLFGSFSERNVRGEANVFSLNALLGTRYSSLSVSYLDRHFRDTNDSLLTRVYYENLVRPGYRAAVIGASPEFGRPLENNWTAWLRARVEGVSLKERDGVDAQEDLNQSYLVATLRLRFDQDTRYPFDLNPREGYLQSYGVEAGYTGGPLLRLDGQRDQYFPINDKYTYRLNALAGFMPYSASVVPIHERYFLGGDNDMRGFKYRSAGYFDDDEEDVPIGGAAKILVKNELLFPIFDPVGGVGFVDVGTLGRTPLSWQMPRVSTGAGIRFNLRNVQVALDLAVPIITQSHDETRFFHFSLQSSFQ